MFSDELSRGKNWRSNQGHAFVIGFSNWKKQYERVRNHQNSFAHKNAKIAEVLFLRDSTIKPPFEKQLEENEDKMRREVLENRDLVKRIIDVIFLLGKQGIAFRGHDEKLSLDLAVNNGNFLESLKVLAKYDVKIHNHLMKVENEQEKSRKKGRKGVA